MSKQEEIREGLLELCIDRDHITITVDRFQQLLKAEAELSFVRKIYHQSKSYELDDGLAIIFGAKAEKKAAAIPVSKLQELLSEVNGDGDA
jgi:hypothetical protein